MGLPLISSATPAALLLCRHYLVQQACITIRVAPIQPLAELWMMVESLGRAAEHLRQGQKAHVVDKMTPIDVVEVICSDRAWQGEIQ